MNIKIFCKIFQDVDNIFRVYKRIIFYKKILNKNFDISSILIEKKIERNYFALKINFFSYWKLLNQKLLNSLILHDTTCYTHYAWCKIAIDIYEYMNL